MKVKTVGGVGLMPAITSSEWTRGKGWDYTYEQAGTLTEISSLVTQLQLAGYSRVKYEPVGNGLWKISASYESQVDNVGLPEVESYEVEWSITGPSEEVSLAHCASAYGLSDPDELKYFEMVAKKCSDEMASQETYAQAQTVLTTWRGLFSGAADALKLFNLFMGGITSLRKPKWGLRKSLSFTSTVGIDLTTAATLLSSNLTKIFTTAQIIADEPTLPDWIRLNLATGATWLKENYNQGAVSGGGRMTASVEYTQQTNYPGLYDAVT